MPDISEYSKGKWYELFNFVFQKEIFIKPTTMAKKSQGSLQNYIYLSIAAAIVTILLKF